MARRRAGAAGLGQIPPREDGPEGAGSGAATSRGGGDWRYQEGVQVPTGAKGLGTIESQEDKLIANKLKQIRKRISG